jgi:hypothetical protein
VASPPTTRTQWHGIVNEIYKKHNTVFQGVYSFNEAEMSILHKERVGPADGNFLLLVAPKAVMH